MKVIYSHTESNVKQWKFPAGEVGVRVEWDENVGNTYANDVAVRARIRNSDDIIALLQVTDIINEKFYHAGQTKRLVLPYVPYARQDRAMVEGETASIRTFARLINSLNYDGVLIYDPHSDVTPALINNATIVTASDLLLTDGLPEVLDYQNKWIVAPDLGAVKRCEKVCADVGALGVIPCTKKRDLATGKLLSYDLLGDVEGKDVIVVDDILDAGGTFHLVADALDAGKVKSKTLYVTHGIFTKGTNGLTERFDHIYTTNTYYGDDIPSELADHPKISWITI